MSVAVVIIGRNEGERFERCLRSLVGTASPIVYVDSGSTDSSVAFAESFAPQGVRVVRLDMTTPFTAARARNAGLDAALAAAPATQFVQFVDGDCEVREGWLDAAARALRDDPSLAAVSGRLRERFPDTTLYNRLADLEWDRPVGEEKSCGGVAMMRVDALRRAGGFDPTLIAGEEPELCARMRALGFRIHRIAHEMAWHDIDMTTRTQWLTRARRHGHAVIEVSWFKTPASRGLFAHHARSALAWGVAWPLCAAACLVALIVAAITEVRVGAVPVWAGAALFLVPLALVYWVQVKRIAAQGRARGLDARSAHSYGVLMMFAKAHQALGMAQFLLRRARRTKPRVIDYRESR